MFLSFLIQHLHNILFLIKKLYLSGKTKNPLCSYCNTNDETSMHLFCECNSTKSLWLQLNRHFHSDLKFPELTPQTAIVGIFNDSVSNIHLINHILLLFKLYIYKSRSKHRLNIQHDLTPKIYVLHKITIALKFMSYINQKLRPSYQTALNLCLT